MSNVKFHEAKFFDPTYGHGWIRISPEEYDADEHHGRIECPEEDCHGSLSYVPEGTAQGHNEDRIQHFRTNPYGEDHKLKCPMTPEGHVFVQRTQKMSAAMEEGCPIRVNLNLPTSYSRDKARLSARIARAKLPGLGGTYTKDWNAAVKGTKPAVFSATSTESVADVVRAFEDAKAETGKHDARIDFVHLHAAIPLESFKLLNGVPDLFQTGLSKMDIFEMLFSERNGSTKKNGNFWSAAPAFRSGLTLINYSRQDNGNNTLLTGQRQRTQIRGKEYQVQDVIDTTRLSPEARQKIRDAERFSLIAMPYISGGQISRVLAAGDTSKPLHIKWPVVDEAQILFEG